MYNFIDTNKQQSGNHLPPEALQINGAWIEEEIVGYRTLNVLGRELSASETRDIQIGLTDGTRYQGKRTPSRVLTIRYQLIASTGEEFRDMFNQLNAILNAEQARFIFNDERDKFFIGTKSGIGEVPAGTNKVIGEFSIYCTDPFKRSVQELSRVATLDNATTFGINYEGSRVSYPRLIAKIQSDCGYIAFANQRGDAIQIGNVEEEDTARADLSETLIREEFTTTALSGWTRNNAVLVTNGGDAEHKQVETMTVNSGRVTPASYGLGVGWHGPSITRNVPADSKGHVGAKNCTLSWVLNFSSRANNQELGLTQLLLTDMSGKNIAAAAFYKHRAADNSGVCHLHVRDKILGAQRLAMAFDNDITGEGHGRCSISKFGEEVTFNLAGKTFAFRVPEIKDIEVAQVSIYMSAFATWPTMNRNNISDVRFVSHSVENWQDVPNRFAVGDEVVVDCEEKTVYLNGVKMPGLAAIGSNWEEFYLEPGINQINSMYSPWATRPDFELRYREVYL